MTLFRVFVVWRIPLAVLIGVISLGIVLISGDLNLQLPMTDGPRLVRQAIVLVLPVTLSALLPPPLPDVHPSLLRFRLHHWVTRGSFWIIMAVVLAAAWVGRGISSNLILFEMMSTLSVAAAALFFVPRLGVRVVLALTGLCSAWLLYGIPMGEVLGFGDLLAEPDDPYFLAPSAMGWMLVSMALGACVLATITTKTGTQPT